jgi:hypothetical protein
VSRPSTKVIKLAGLTADLLNLQSLMNKLDHETRSFIEVDTILSELRRGSEPNQLPPNESTLSTYIVVFVEAFPVELA